MLIRPGCVASRSMDNAVDGIRADKVPWIYGLAAIKRIAGQAGRIDRLKPSIERAVRSAAVQLSLIDIDSLFIFGSRAVRCSGSTLACEDAVSGVFGRRRQHAIVGDIIVNPS